MKATLNYISERPLPRRDSTLLIKECAGAFSPDISSLSAWHQEYSGNHATRLAYDLDILRDFAPSGSTVLEIGSIPLIFTLAVSRSGYVLTGCDLAPERYSNAIASLGLNVCKCNTEVEPLPFEDGSFDVVIFNEIFEHLRINPIFTLGQVLRVLKPGATLMLSSPNLRSLKGLLNFLLKNRAYSCCSDLYAEYQKLERIGHMGHVREYTTTEVIGFLEKVGFEITDVIFRGEYYSTSQRAITRFFPNLRPFVSYIGRRPAALAR